MYLAKLDRGHTIGKKVMLTLFRVLGRAKVPDVVKTLLYRPEFFGTPHARFHEAVMRGPGDWSVGERELMAAFVSERNRCRFCTSVHRAVAHAAGVANIVDATLKDPDTADLTPQLRAILKFLDKLTIAPDTVTAADAEAVRAAGVSDTALLDAIYICFMFCVMNRLMDAFGAEFPSQAQLDMSARILLGRGYEVV